MRDILHLKKNSIHKRRVSVYYVCMTRAYLAPNLWNDAVPRLDEAESHHLRRVLRYEEGDSLRVFNGLGCEAEATIAAFEGKRALLSMETPVQSPVPACAISLVQSVIKGKNMDLIIQKAVEIGVAEIVPLLTERTIARPDRAECERKCEKWRTLAVEACKQCGQNFLPAISSIISPREYLQGSGLPELLLIASLQSDARHLKKILADYSSLCGGARVRRAAVMIGPEGDFSPAEIALAIECGAKPLSLGSTVLRSETAAIYGLSILAHELLQD